MKNKIVLFVLLTMCLTLPAHFQQANGQVNEKKTGLTPFNRLIVKSNVRVVLIEDEKVDSARIEGTKKFLESVMIIQAGEDLIVRAKSFKDLKKKGTVYIPVHKLKDIEVNSDAKIISFTMIRSPELNVLINGNCVVSLVLKGKLNIIEADGFNASFRRVYHQTNTPVYLDIYLNN